MIKIRQIQIDEPVIDMTPNGEFVEPPPTSFATKLFRIAVIVAACAVILGFAALVLGAALALIPIGIGAAMVAYATLRWRLWRERKWMQRRGG